MQENVQVGLHIATEPGEDIIVDLHCNKGKKQVWRILISNSVFSFLKK